jgi:PAS domain S-box-containing protein
MVEEMVRVLLAEDEAINAELMTETLSNLPGGPFSVRVVQTIRECCTALEREFFDLLLLDLHLADGNSLDALASNRIRTGDIPVIVLTADDDEVTGERAIGFGAQDFLFKGKLNGEVLRRSIRYALQRHRLIRELHESEERFRKVYSQSPLGIAVYGPDEKPYYVNHTLLSMIGVYGHEQLEQIPLSDLPFFRGRRDELVDPKPLLHFEWKYEGESFRALGLDCDYRAGDAWWSVMVSKLYLRRHEGFSGWVLQVQDISERVVVENKIRNELNVASHIQKSIGAPELLEGANFLVHSRYIPSEELGGDFLDILPRRNLVYIVSADISGHGLIASLFTFLLKAIVKANLTEDISAETLMAQIGREIRKYLIDDYFCTMAVFRIDTDTRHVSYAHAGHTPFLVSGPAGTREFKLRSMFISQILPESWISGEIVMEHGDRLFIFTDGLFEVDKGDREIVGVPFVSNYLAASAVKDGAELIDVLIEQLRRYRPGGSFEDDISVCLFEWKGKKIPGLRAEEGASGPLRKK